MQHDIGSEEDVIEVALLLDQAGTPMASAQARALRGLGVPLFRHVMAEMQRWRKSDDAMCTVASLGKIIGASYARMIAAVSDKGEMREAFKKEILDGLLVEINRAIELNED